MDCDSYVTRYGECNGYSFGNGYGFGYSFGNGYGDGYDGDGCGGGCDRHGYGYGDGNGYGDGYDGDGGGYGYSGDEDISFANSIWSGGSGAWVYFCNNTPMYPLNGRRVSPITKPQEPTT